ncbi:MAG TPA: hypothetical protein VH740_04465 [Vicinamibacterales bacterium]|jgi:hypothetical protein
MPDWQRLTADGLAQTRLAPEVRRDVVEEIAAHLEECYGESLDAGSADAEQQARAQVSDWRALGRSIRRSKEDPMNVVRRVILPGIAAVIVALGALRLCVYVLITPHACGVDDTCILITADGPAYLPWLASLPFAGALAAALSRRVGGQLRQRVLAAVCPAAYFAGEIVYYSLLDAFYWRIPIYWILIPAIACAIGAIPFLGGRRDTVEAQPLTATS